jgi:hypothetical protein
MELLQLFLASVILLVTGTAVILTLIGFFPHFTAQGAATVEQSPGRVLVVGLVNLLFLGILILTLFALGENVAQVFTIPALILLLALVASILLGLPGLAFLLGQRLWPERQPFTRHAYAAALLLLASLAPFVGWFILLPVLLTHALGLCVLVFIGRLQQGQVQPAEETMISDT